MNDSDIDAHFPPARYKAHTAMHRVTLGDYESLRGETEAETKARQLREAPGLLNVRPWGESQGRFPVLRDDLYEDQSQGLTFADWASNGIWVAGMVAVLGGLWLGYEYAADIVEVSGKLWALWRSGLGL